MAAWIAESPGDAAARRQRLEGDPLAYSQVVILLSSTMRWLAAQGRHEEAARLASAAEMALRATSSTPWEVLGEAQRLRAAVEEVGGSAAPDDVPSDLDELYDDMASLFAAGDP
jgi:hypothetical protein